MFDIRWRRREIKRIERLGIEWIIKINNNLKRNSIGERDWNLEVKVFKK